MADETEPQHVRTYPPPQAFAAAARVPSMDEYRRQYRRSIDDPDGFWAEVAGAFRWQRPFDRVLEWVSPDAKWFVGGRLNVAENCLDVQVTAGRGDKVAVLFEPEPVGEPVRRITYRQLLADVCRFANGLKTLGVKRGDRVTIYLPHVPEAVVAMLACARIGAAHSGHLRRLLEPVDRRPAERRPEPLRRHRRRRVPAGEHRPAEGERR